MTDFHVCIIIIITITVVFIFVVVVLFSFICIPPQKKKIKPDLNGSENLFFSISFFY